MNSWAPVQGSKDVSTLRNDPDLHETIDKATKWCAKFGRGLPVHGRHKATFMV